MSVQTPYSKRLEIRLDDKLKKCIQLFCEEKQITPSMMFRELAKWKLKKEGFIVKRDVTKAWDGDVEDMPFEMDKEVEEWARVV